MHLPSLKLTSTDCSIIHQGGLCVRENWVDMDIVMKLQDDIASLRSSQSFQPSGLSNRVVGDTNEFDACDRLTCTITPSLPGDAAGIRSLVEDRLEILRLELQDSLGCHADFHLAEHYYSVSPAGSLLPRHMDERHEETKGEKGWMNDTRRSISWLLYLNGMDWNSGGELRAYCRSSVQPCGAHDGNLQVGWLECDADDNNEDFDPVFLDSWCKTTASEEDSWQWRPLSALYRLDENKKREYLTDPFGPDSPTWPSQTDVEPLEFAAALSSQLPSEYVSFIGVEDIDEVEPIDIVPTGGTLVLFDSATVPHSVLTTTSKGKRLAMAGWFHESTQDFPDWYGT